MKCIPGVILILWGTMMSLGCLDPSAEQGDPPDELLLMTWNCQNLFDGIHDGTEYSEFDPAGGKWTEELYRKRLALTAGIIRSAAEEGPDILFLQEVENRRVVEDLNRELGRSGYRWMVVTEEEGNAIQLAVLSRYPLEGIRLWQPGYFDDNPLRPVVELQVVVGNERILLFNNHWKSKSEGIAETEPARLLSASLLSQRVMAGGLCCAAGDFNTELDDPGLLDPDLPVEPALSRWFPESPETWKGLALTMDRTLLAGEGAPSGLLFEPWTDTGCPGSYVFNGDWSRPDHFFLSAEFFDGSGWEYQTMEVLLNPVMLNKRGEPLRWITSTDTGYSDHLPLLLRLVRLSGE